MEANKAGGDLPLHVTKRGLQFSLPAGGPVGVAGPFDGKTLGWGRRGGCLEVAAMRMGTSALMFRLISTTASVKNHSSPANGYAALIASLTSVLLLRWHKIRMGWKHSNVAMDGSSLFRFSCVVVWRLVGRTRVDMLSEADSCVGDEKASVSSFCGFRQIFLQGSHRNW